jgi:hypothetical protein
MKKTHTPKLSLKLETVKELAAPDLQRIAGGATVAGHVCAQPTTTTSKNTQGGVC